MPRIKWSADLGPEYDLRRFQRLRRRLSNDFPPPCRVVVKLVEKGTIRDENDCRLFARAIPYSKSWLILIERSDDISVSLDSLIHEWSHCLAPPVRKSHHERWNKMRNKIERHYLGD